jgi:hypothetical protein
MKHTKILLAIMICFVLGCSSPDVLEEKNVGKPGEGSGGGTYASIATRTTTLSTMQSGTASILSAMKSSPSSYIVTENGLKYIKFQNSTGLSAFNYINNYRVIYSTEFATITWDQARTEIVGLLDNLKNHTSAPFRSNLLSTFDYVRNNIDGLTFAQFESYMESKLSGVASQPVIYGIPRLTANEQFALTQAYYTLLNQVKWVAQSPAGSATSCLPTTKDEWKDVAKKALVGGLTAGLTLGWKGVVSGMIATGGHPVGGIVGGLAGFVAGFAGGAIMTGGVYLTAGCIANKLFSFKRAFQCSSGIYYAYSVAAPMGCTAIEPSPDLRSILDMGLMPNKGKTSLATSVVNDINWLLSYF